eukprot:TRINITY_DN4895_c0_g1_i1.p1 TRINITY_DN4895_c0_g1~~TRINITY_DN4895_c0_g1_i1.p1  ORF type:complete len:217 (-),score=32.99 TRINITY_DN4895_c0_g1_i1:32-682(-)
MVDFNPGYIHSWKTRLQIVDGFKVKNLSDILERVSNKQSRNPLEDAYALHLPQFIPMFINQVNTFRNNFDVSIGFTHIHNDIHFGNVIFQQGSPEILALIDFDMAQYDHSIVEFNNIIFATGEGTVDSITYDITRIIHIFKIVIEAYQNCIENQLSPQELSNAWETLRCRILENAYKSIVHPHSARDSLQFNIEDRVLWFNNILYLVGSFPESIDM